MWHGFFNASSTKKLVDSLIKLVQNENNIKFQHTSHLYVQYKLLLYF